MRWEFFFFTILFAILLFQTSFGINPKLIRTLEGGESNEVNCYTISDDGKTLYIQYKLRKGSQKINTIYIWNITENQLQDSISTNSEFYDMVVSKEEDFLVCIEPFSNNAAVFDLTSRKFLRSDVADTKNLMWPGIFSITKVEGTNTYALVEYTENKIQVFDFKTGEKVRDIQNLAEGNVSLLKLSDDERYGLFYYGQESKASVVSLIDGFEYAKFEIIGQPEYVSFAKNNPFVIINYKVDGNANPAQIFNFENGVQIKEIEVENLTNKSIFSDNEMKIITGYISSSNLQVNLFDLGTKYVSEGKFKGHHLKNYNESADVCIANTNGDFFIFNPMNKNVRFKIEKPIPLNITHAISSKATPNGKYIFVGDNNSNDILIFDILKMKKLGGFTLANKASSFDFTEDSKTLIISDINSNVSLWDLSDIDNIIKSRNFQLDSARHAVISRDGKIIVAGGLGKKLYLIDLTTNNISVIDTTASTIHCITISNNNQKIALCTYHDLIVLEKSSESQKYIRKATVRADSSLASSGGIRSVAFSKEDDYIIISASDFKSRLFSGVDYSFIRSYRAPAVEKRSSLISSSLLFEKGKYMLNTDGIPSLRIFDNKFGNHLWTYQDESKPAILSCQVTDDDVYMIITYVDASIQLWRLYSPTFIEEDNDLLNMNIYPNPTSDYITINMESIGASSNGNNIWASPNASIEIFDMLGLEVAQAPLSVNNMKNTQTGASELLRIDVSHLPAGVYFIKIVGCNGACSIVEKFVKM